ncbi:hypothetical protein BKK79_23685 [Cupriavidus sp. USMAA2-4]|uniref:Uncharacterized protein n=1 Tax=Cupriavidus malaysiensis TaxID=367825 RepID=A0ABN4TTN7_9BURK|nr:MULTISPECIES: hypothetical protein [Cupriavidus]AOY94869.1 hypothetical protein BKK79_23685 [Cupriavidus sp. USMAA2-4]AOZ10368.1 hypothetical protein BKK80_32805 [Cupriavidus malaysiensis]
MTDQDNPGKAQDKRARNNRWLFRAMVVAVAAIAVANLLLGENDGDHDDGCAPCERLPVSDT